MKKFLFLAMALLFSANVLFAAGLVGIATTDGRGGGKSVRTAFKNAKGVDSFFPQRLEGKMLKFTVQVKVRGGRYTTLYSGSPKPFKVNMNLIKRLLTMKATEWVFTVNGDDGVKQKVACSAAILANGGSFPPFEGGGGERGGGEPEPKPEPKPQNKKPSASLSVSPSSVKTGSTVTFNAARSSDPENKIVKYEWYVNGKSVGSTTSANYSYKSSGSGTVRVSVKVIDHKGASDSAEASFSVLANKAPTAKAGNNMVVNPGETVSFNAGGSSDPDGKIVSYSWNFGGKGSSSSSRPSFKFSRPGTYTVSLTVTDDSGAKASDSIRVTVNSSPSANAGIDMKAKVNNSIEFDGALSSDSDGSISSYAWYIGSKKIGSAQSASYKFGREGTYEVKLVVTDNHGASSSDTIKVSVEGNSKPVAEIGLSTTVYFNGSASFDKDGSIESYHWNFGDGSSSTSPSPKHTYKKPGTYTVTLTVKDKDGASSTKEMTVLIASDSVEVIGNSFGTASSDGRGRGNAVTIPLSKFSPSASTLYARVTEGTCSYYTVQAKLANGRTMTLHKGHITEINIANYIKKLKVMKAQEIIVYVNGQNGKYSNVKCTAKISIK